MGDVSQDELPATIGISAKAVAQHVVTNLDFEPTQGLACQDISAELRHSLAFHIAFLYVVENPTHHVLIICSRASLYKAQLINTNLPGHTDEFDGELNHRASALSGGVSGCWQRVSIRYVTESGAQDGKGGAEGSPNSNQDHVTAPNKDSSSASYILNAGNGSQSQHGSVEDDGLLGLACALPTFSHHDHVPNLVICIDIVPLSCFGAAWEGNNFGLLHPDADLVAWLPHWSRKVSGCMSVLSAVADGFGERNLAEHMVQQESVTLPKDVEKQPQTCGFVMLDPWIHLNSAIVGHFSALCGTLWRLHRAGLDENVLDAVNIMSYDSEPLVGTTGNRIVV